MAASPESTARRIVVAIDMSTDSLAALELAARLAGATRAQLQGLFVEDINLLHLAALPFAQEVSWPNNKRRPLTEEDMEYALQLRASRARRMLAHAAEAAEAEWSFRVVRGRVTSELLEAASGAALLSLGFASRQLTSGSRVGATAKTVAARAGPSVLLACRGVHFRQPIAVLYDGTGAAERALDAAIDLARANESNLVIMILSDVPDQVPRLAAAAGQRLEDQPIHTDYRQLALGDRTRLVQALQREKCGLLVLGTGSPLLAGDGLQRLLEQLACPAMLVR